MRQVVCSMGVSLDGSFVGPDGGLDWGAPDEDVFAALTEELRGLGVHLMGRRLYETMLFWEHPEADAALSDAEREWAGLWRALPKVVFSTTSRLLEGTARPATGTLAEEVERWRGEPGEGDVAVGGAELAAQVAAAGLLDEYRLRLHPVVLGGGRPLFGGHGRRADLELVDHRTFPSGVLLLRHRVRR